jgi:flagellar basal-body rod protein FlgG
MSIPSLMEILDIARSSMFSRIQDLDLVSHNLANINTPGFKSSRSVFQENIDGDSFAGVMLKTTQRDLNQGQLHQTNNPLDLAVSGEGWFSVELADGRIGYTRDGQFRVDSEGSIVNLNGYRLVWNGTIPEDADGIAINPDGTVIGSVEGVWDEVGQINLTRFSNPQTLLSYGQGLWVTDETSAEPQDGIPGDEGFGNILGFSVEQSNVDIAEQMTRMVILQRDFDMSVRAFQQTDGMIGLAIRMRRG